LTALPIRLCSYDFLAVSYIHFSNSRFSLKHSIREPIELPPNAQLADDKEGHIHQIDSGRYGLTRLKKSFTSVTDDNRQGRCPLIAGSFLRSPDIYGPMIKPPLSPMNSNATQAQTLRPMRADGNHAPDAASPRLLLHHCYRNCSTRGYR
jgi:hypothetical protein